MALSSCGDCGKQVSSMAIACPQCGAPMKGTMRPAGVVTTQDTAKVMLVGVAACSAGAASASGWFFALGLLVWLGARAAVWWHNG